MEYQSFTCWNTTSATLTAVTYYEPSTEFFVHSSLEVFRTEETISNPLPGRLFRLHSSRTAPGGFALSIGARG